MILLYADDPGAANYLAPVASALPQCGMEASFVVDASLERFAVDRGIRCSVRSADSSAGKLLNGVDLLVVGTSEDRDCFGHRLTDMARGKGIATLGVVDMHVNAARRFQGASQDPLRHAPDIVAVPDNVCRDAFLALGMPGDRLRVCGHPHFDSIRERGVALANLGRQSARAAIYPRAPTDRPIWLFLAEGVDRLNPPASFRTKDYSLTGRGDTDFRACIVLEEILDIAADLNPAPWIVLRLHPKSDINDFAPVRAEVSEISFEGDPLPMLWAADLVIGMTTMLLQDSYLLRRPHLSVIPRAEERAWLGTLLAGLTLAVWDRNELQKALSGDPENLVPVGDRLPASGVELMVECIKQMVDSRTVSAPIKAKP